MCLFRLIILYYNLIRHISQWFCVKCGIINKKLCFLWLYVLSLKVNNSKSQRISVLFKVVFMDYIYNIAYFF